MLIDSHAHLDDKRLIDRVGEIASNFAADGVEFVINASCDERTLKSSVALAEQFENIFSLIGTHPHDATAFDDNMRQAMRQLSTHPKVVGVGEIGLDYFHNFSPRDVQRQVFAEQIEMADKFGLPVVLHVRDAYEDTLKILQEKKRFLNNGILLHCFSGSAESVREFSRFDCYFAFGGAITFDNAKKSEVIKAVPIDRLLTETDCPYLTPVPHRGKVNEPKFVRHVVDKLAQTLEKSESEIEEIVRQNTLRLFKKIER